MSFVLTTGSDIECPDHGKATLTSTAKLTISGTKVIVKSDVMTASGFSLACTQVTTSNNKQCSKVLAIIKGEATKLTVSSRPVMLDSLAGTTDGVPNNALSAKDAAQKKLTAK